MKIILAINCIITYAILFRVSKFQNVEDGYRDMPKLYDIDDFESCMKDKDGLYCLVDIELSSNKPSKLLQQIKNFSADSLHYFRHDLLHRGICVKQRCNMSSLELVSLQNNRQTIQTMWDKCSFRDITDEYGFDIKVSLDICNMPPPQNSWNWVYVQIIGVIVLLNIIGSIFTSDEQQEGFFYKFLRCFRLQNNAKSILLSENHPSSPGKKWLHAFEGLRAILMCLVIISHAFVIVYKMYLENPEYLEMVHRSDIMVFTSNGTMLMQIFFGLSSFLMSYNILKYAQNHPQQIGYSNFPMLLFQRWLRYIPAYAVSLGFIALWSDRLIDSAMSGYLSIEAEACRKYWWKNIFFFHNLDYESFLCLPQAWWSCVEMQLFCFGLVIIISIIKFPSLAKYILGLCLLTTIIIPGVITYINNYEPIVILRPEVVRQIFRDDIVFKNMYIQPQGNAGGYIMGLIAGYIYHIMETNNIQIKPKYWLDVLMSSIGPILLLFMIFSGAIFQFDTYDPVTTATYAAVHKQIFSGLIVVFFISIASNYDSKWKRSLESKVFTIPSRLSYCAFLVHMVVEKYLLGIQSQLAMLTITNSKIIFLIIMSLIATYTLAFFLCLFVEMPFGNVQKLIFNARKTSETKMKKTN